MNVRGAMNCATTNALYANQRQGRAWHLAGRDQEVAPTE